MPLKGMIYYCVFTSVNGLLSSQQFIHTSSWTNDITCFQKHPSPHIRQIHCFFFLNIMLTISHLVSTLKYCDCCFISGTIGISVWGLHFESSQRQHLCHIIMHSWSSQLIYVNNEFETVKYSDLAHALLCYCLTFLQQILHNESR